MVRGLFRRPKVLSAHQRVGGELGIFTIRLIGVEDPFDPDPLWDRRYGGNANIRDELTGDRDFRLQAALDGCRNMTFARDEAGRFRERNPVFTDVVMWIPAPSWHADARRSGQRIEAVAHNLALLHQKKFARSLPDTRAPSYTVMPDEELQESAVVFQFGFGVFVPRPDDVLIAEIALRAPSAPEPRALREWSFWIDGAQVKRPVGVYRSQPSLVIAADSSAPVRAPIWFQHPTGHLLINLNPADSERIYTNDDNIRIVSTPASEVTDDTAEWVLEHADGDGKNADALIVRMTSRAGLVLPLPADAGEAEGEPLTTEAPEPIDLEPAPSPHESPSRAPGARRDEPGKPSVLGDPKALHGFDGVPDRAPLSMRHMLRLVGIALLRIDGAKQVAGLDEWTIWFDDDGWPIQEDRSATVDPASCLAVSARAGDQNVYVRSPGARDYVRVTAPCPIPTKNGEHLMLTPSPLADRHHGILMLLQEMAFPLSPHPLVLGRSDSRPEAPQPDLPIELLTHPENLRWRPGTKYVGTKLNAVNLSRRHVSLALNNGALEVTMAEGSTAVYILDEAGAMMQRLKPRSTVGMSLAPEQMILVGNYLFRFHREETPTVSTLECTIGGRKTPP